MKTYITNMDHLEQMAHRHAGTEIELTTTAAFLTVGGTTWYALVQP